MTSVSVWERHVLMFPIEFSVRLRGMQIRSCSKSSGRGDQAVKRKALPTVCEILIRAFSLVRKV
jgi:hypothetical protein